MGKLRHPTTMESPTSQPRPNEVCLQEVWEGLDADLRNMSTDEDKLGHLVSIQSFSFSLIKHGPIDPLWRIFIESAKALDDPFQDRLLSLLLWTKEFDKLNTRVHGLVAVDTAAGTSMLDSFADYLQTEWDGMIATGTNVQSQCNLATFSAKALAIGVCGNSIGFTALRYLREALETDDQAKCVALLPAAVVWMKYGSHKLLVLSALNVAHDGHDENSNDSEIDGGASTPIVEPGDGATKAGIASHRFSIDRWLLWRRRFQELSHSAQPEVAKLAHQGFMSMVHCGRDFGYEVPGETRFAERLQKAMWEELVRSGKESVDGDEIDIDADWVD